jgi:hypothetical protein
LYQFVISRVSMLRETTTYQFVPVRVISLQCVKGNQKYTGLHQFILVLNWLQIVRERLLLTISVIWKGNSSRLIAIREKKLQLLYNNCRSFLKIYADNLIAYKEEFEIAPLVLSITLIRVCSLTSQKSIQNTTTDGNLSRGNWTPKKLKIKEMIPS